MDEPWPSMSFSLARRRSLGVGRGDLDDLGRQDTDAVGGEEGAGDRMSRGSRGSPARLAGSPFRTEGGWEPQGRTLLRAWLWS